MDGVFKAGPWLCGRLDERGRFPGTADPGRDWHLLGGSIDYRRNRQNRRMVSVNMIMCGGGREHRWSAQVLGG